MMENQMVKETANRNETTDLQAVCRNLQASLVLPFHGCFMVFRIVVFIYFSISTLNPEPHITPL